MPPCGSPRSRRWRSSARRRRSALIDKAIEDADRGVRLAAVRAAGARGYKGALKRVEAVVLGKGVKEMDLTEKMAFFEAYGAIAGRRRPQGR